MSNYRRELLKSGKEIPKTIITHSNTNTTNTNTSNTSKLLLNTTKLSTFTPTISQIKTNISKLESTITQLQNEISNMKSELLVYESKTDNIRSCECDKNDIEKRLVELKQTLDEESSVSDALCEEVDELKEIFDPSEMDLIKASLTANTADLTSLKSLVQGNKTQCSADFSKLRSEINLLKKEIINLKNKK